jgi:hypothetical protein
VSTITFCGREVKLCDGAQEVIVGGQVIELFPRVEKVVFVALQD